MSFAKRIFLALLGVSLVTGVTRTYFLYGTVQDHLRSEYVADYSQRVQLLASSFLGMEDASETAALNAGRVVAEKIRAARKLPTEAELNQLAQELQVAHFEIVQPDGKFIRGMNGNLFDYCSDYRELFTGKTVTQQTPIVPDGQGGLYKYTLLATADRKYVIDVSVRFDSVTRLLRQMLDADPDLDRVEIFSPTGVSLGRINSAGIADRSDATPELLGADQVGWRPGKLIISRSLQEDSQNCCECRIKKLVGSDGRFSYRLLASVSTQTLQASLRSFKLKFLAIFIAITALALALAWWITALLLRKVNRIRAAVENVGREHDYAVEVPVETKSDGTPRDELDLLASEFNGMVRAVRDSQEKIIEAKKAEAQSVIAAQVAHDIRSPLTSMGIALNQLQQGISSDALATMKHGIDRVAGILKKLSNTYAKKTDTPTDSVEIPRLTLLDSIIKNVILEHEVKLANAPGKKKLVTEGFAQTPCIWSVVQVTEIQSALSNVLNNAAEAISEESGQIKITLSQQGSQLTLSIQDNGVGIPTENLEKIFERRFTQGKAQGTGLGLFQAKSAVEWNGGKITVQSQPRRGSCFVITLPTERKPDWIASGLKLAAEDQLVFVDDDPSVLSLWKFHIGPALASRASFFKSIDELKKAIPTRPWPAERILIIDQFLGPESSGTRGLDFLTQLDLKNRGYLCTSEYDDPEIQAQIRKAGLRLIPKPCISGFSIT